MRRGITYFLVGMLVFLTVGMVAIVGAAVDRNRGIAMACASAAIILALWGGSDWWRNDAALSNQKLYKPLGITVSLDKPDHMELRITDPGWLPCESSTTWLRTTGI
jgi:hypothetical protein